MTTPPPLEPTPLISVVVPFFDRVALLERTLEALARQVTSDGLTWEVLVADNHPDQLGLEVVAAFAGRGAFRHVRAEPLRNIAAARNRAVEAARGRLIAFVDDDEEPVPDFLAQHLACLQRTGADASFGPVEPVFEAGAPPDWDPTGRYFRVNLQLPADTQVNPLNWWHAGGRGLGIGNCMMTKESCLAGANPFDETMGRAGGEDTQLILNLARQGRRLVWCPAAIVTEMNPAGRCSAEYMATRVHRSASHSAIFRVQASDRPWLTRLVVLGIGSAQVVLHGLFYLLRRRKAAEVWVPHRLGIAKGLGKLGIGRDLDFLPEGAPARS